MSGRRKESSPEELTEKVVVALVKARAILHATPRVGFDFACLVLIAALEDDDPSFDGEKILEAIGIDEKDRKERHA